VNLPQRLLNSVLQHDRGGYVEAVEVRAALAITLLLVAPMRIKNLALLNLERDFVRWHPGPSAVVHLVVPNELVKNKRPLEFELRSDVAKLLDLYIQRFRPRLVTGPSPWLFPARDGGPKAPQHLGAHVANTITKETGLQMNVHLFRHFAAFLFLKAHPGAYETVAQLLGDSIATVTRFYAGFEQADAFRRYDEVLDRYRRPDGDDDDEQP
jgi:integrase